jgi:chromosomal replication initiation ATPase DnaA
MNYQQQVEHYKAVRARISGVVVKLKTIQEIQPEPEPDPEPEPKARVYQDFRKRIIADCAKEFGISVEDLLGNSRVNHIVMARRKAAWIFYQRGTMSYQQIGRLLNKDHSTIIHAVQKYQKSLE